MVNLLRFIIFLLLNNPTPLQCGLNCLNPFSFLNNFFMLHKLNGQISWCESFANQIKGPFQMLRKFSLIYSIYYLWLWIKNTLSDPAWKGAILIISMYDPFYPSHTPSYIARNLLIGWSYLLIVRIYVSTRVFLSCFHLKDSPHCVLSM